MYHVQLLLLWRGGCLHGAPLLPHLHGSHLRPDTNITWQAKTHVANKSHVCTQSRMQGGFGDHRRSLPLAHSLLLPRNHDDQTHRYTCMKKHRCRYTQALKYTHSRYSQPALKKPTSTRPPRLHLRAPPPPPLPPRAASTPHSASPACSACPVLPRARAVH